MPSKKEAAAAASKPETKQQAKLPGDLTMGELRPDFEDISGFVRQPHKDDEEEIPRAFNGVLRSIVPSKKANRAAWGVFEVFEDQPECEVIDDENESTSASAGMFVGVTIKGALKTLLDKTDDGDFKYLDRYCRIRWTGKKIEVPTGEMYEAKCLISKETVPRTGGEPQF